MYNKLYYNNYKENCLWCKGLNNIIKRGCPADTGGRCSTILGGNILGHIRLFNLNP